MAQVRPVLILVPRESSLGYAAMSFRKAVEEKDEFRHRQRERRARGGLRRHQRREVEHKIKFGVKEKRGGDETPSENEDEDDDSASEDDSPSSSTQTRTSISSQTPQALISTLSRSTITFRRTTTVTQISGLVATTVNSRSNILTTLVPLTSTPLASSLAIPAPLVISQPAIIPMSQSTITNPESTFSTPQSTSTSAPQTSRTFRTAAAETAGSGISSTQLSNNNNSKIPTAAIFGVVGAIGRLSTLLQEIKH